ncbi:MAG: hypothetical protein ABIP81_00820 [Terriglobales bacterium]
MESALAQQVPSALTVREKPAPEVFPTGIPALDALTGMGGLPRSALTEICGPASSGRTSVLLSLLAQATARHEACALIDACDAFHPESAQSAGVELTRVLWVRCGNQEPNQNFSPQRDGKEKQEQNQTFSPQRAQRNAKVVAEQKPNHRKPSAKGFDRLEQALKATDLLLQSGGFGLLIVDLADLSPEVTRRVPLTSWFRFRRAVEETSTALVVLEQEPFARTCASLVLRLSHKQAQWSSVCNAEIQDLKLPTSRLFTSGFYAPAANNYAAPPAHARLLGGLELDVEVIRTRKAVPSSAATVSTQTAWAG